MLLVKWKRYCFRVKQTDGSEGDRPRAGDEGAEYTKRLMAAVTRLRNSKQPRWSAERLAAEMASVGVPWTRNSVVNLESGRRKQIAVHELLALAVVLRVENPMDLIVPPGDVYEQLVFPVIPFDDVSAASVRAWFGGAPEQLRQELDGRQPEPGAIELLRVGELPDDVRRDLIERLSTPKWTIVRHDDEGGGDEGGGDGPG